MRIKFERRLLALIVVLPLVAFGQSASITNVQVASLSSTSATITFSTGVAVFAGVSYAPAKGNWVTVNDAYDVNHSVTLSGLIPGTVYSYVPWYSNGVNLPAYSFTTPANSSGPAISGVQVANLTSNSATINFSTGTAVFAGISYAAANGGWTTVNEAYAVNHSVNLTGLTPGTTYNYVPWFAGGTSLPAYSFNTLVAASSGSSSTSSGSSSSTGTSSSGSTAPGGSATTNIDVGTSVIQSGLKHLGMNIEGQDFYDSGQLLRNLVFRNPGFEGETWQSILHCSAVTATSCTDSNVWTQWPANFLQGATFQYIYGAANGQTGTVLASTAANSGSNTGMTVNFSPTSTSPTVGDFVVVRMTIPGNAQAGWWSSTSGGGTLTTDFTDLSPESPGRQALSMNASGDGQVAQVDSYFDTSNTRNFVLLNGSYQIAFRAKGTGGGQQLTVSLGREIPNGAYFSKTVSLSRSWQDYTFTFSAAEIPATPVGAVDLRFQAAGASAYLDDVAVTPVKTTSTNPTAFRDEVVNTLLTLHPGTLRYMDDGGPAFGASIDNMIAVPFARQRSGSSESSAEEDDVPLGLNEFLELCETVGADPWYTLPPAITPAEMQNLMQFLAGDASTPYGAKRAALGQIAPWTSMFSVIHLELGNEQWNNVTFPGNSISDPVAYANEVTSVFGAAKSSPYYSASGFDLIMGSFVVNPWYTGQEEAHGSNYDSIAVAPYMFGTFNDASSQEAIFGPMFAEPEMWDSTSGGWMYQQQQTASKAGKNLVDYEENLGTQSGSVSQAMLNSVIPSVAGGITMADHMLLQMRDLGVKIQNVWALPGYSNQFNSSNGLPETVPLFGTVVDMGGQTNLQRPVFLAEQIVNAAILPDMLATTVSGANPTWSQSLSTNDSTQLDNAHYLQSFAFTDGGVNRSVVVVNLSRTSPLVVTFSGANAPTGIVNVSQLTSASLTDSNEAGRKVATTNTTIQSFEPASPYSLPPFSVTVLSWQNQ